jgi:putative NADH-flavin reductase
MKITIIGASAGVGLETVKRALDRNHQVTTLSRSEINLQHKNLNTIKGSATNKTDLKKSIENANAVIIALGTGKSMKATTLYSDFAKLLVDVQIDTNTQIPFIVLTGFGAGESGKYVHNFVMKLFFKYFLNDVYADKTIMENIIEASQLKWEIVRPGFLKDKPLTEKYIADTKLYKGISTGGFKGSINRSDVADYMVKQAENPTELFKYVSLSNK